MKQGHYTVRETTERKRPKGRNRMINPNGGGYRDSTQEHKAKNKYHKPKYKKYDVEDFI